MVEGDREKDGVKERNVRPRAGFLRSENLLHRLSFLSGSLAETSTAFSCIPVFIGPSLVYSPGLDYCISTSPFPPLVPLDILPFTTTSFPPLCTNTSCCLPVHLPIDSQGPPLPRFLVLHGSAYHRLPPAWLHSGRKHHCVSTRSRGPWTLVTNFQLSSCFLSSGNPKSALQQLTCFSS